MINKRRNIIHKIKSPIRRPKKLTSRDLLNKESEIGGSLFGKIPDGRRREFFMVNENSWIWHEEWTDKSGQKHELTTRYEIKKDKVIKIQPGPRYYELKGRELANFHLAVKAYHHKVLHQIYGKTN